MTDKSQTAKKLWLWKNGLHEYVAYDNPYPCISLHGDPLTLGEPCGFAIFKESVNGRPNEPEVVTIANMVRAHE